MRIRMMTSFLAMVVLASSVLAAEPGTKQVEHKYMGESINRVEIELPPDTKLNVRTSPEKIISVAGAITVHFEGSPSKVRQRGIMDGMDVSAEMRGNRLRIFDSRDGAARSGWARRLDTDYVVTVTVPDWTAVEVSQRNGVIDAAGKLGNVKVGMRAGEIRLEVPKERVKELTARTKVGEVTADYGRITEQLEGFLPGETRYENENGLTRIDLKLTMGDISVKLTE